MGKFQVSIESHFCSAHALRNYKGTTEPTHGHNFKVIVVVDGAELDEAGMLVDFLDLKPLVDREIGRLNYCNLNEDVEEFQEAGLSPSAENIAKVIFERLATAVSNENLPVRLGSVQVYESPGCSAIYLA